jgi:hypothetical protein
MGAIKDIIGLLTQLGNIIQKIQASMLAIHDENAARVSEISDLKKQILALEKKYSSLEINRPAPREEAAAEISRDEPENIDKIESASQEVLPVEKLADKVSFIKDAKDAPQEVSSVEMQDKPEFVDEKKPESREQVSAEELTDKPEVIEEEPPAPKEKTAAEILQEKYEFIKKFGIYKSKESGRYFCAACLMNNIESPLTEKLSGWQCQLKDCSQFYIKPGYKEPKRKRQTKYLQW